MTNLEVKSASICLYAFSIEDHRIIVIDLSYSSILGFSILPIAPLLIHYIISSNPIVVKNYLKKVNIGLVEYKTKAKLRRLLDS